MDIKPHSVLLIEEIYLSIYLKRTIFRGNPVKYCLLMGEAVKNCPCTLERREALLVKELYVITPKWLWSENRV